MICSNCGTANDQSYKFCMRCGRPLVAEPPPPPVAARPEPEPPAAAPPPQRVNTHEAPPPPARVIEEEDPFATRPGQQPVYPSQAYPPAYIPPNQAGGQPDRGAHPAAYPSQATPPQPPQNYPPAQGQQYPPQNYNSYGQPPYNQPDQYRYGSQSTGLGSLRGPFAGYGQRRRHVGWLLDNKGDCAEQLNTQVKNRFFDRRIPEGEHLYTRLMGKGLLVETRPYFILRRGLVSLGLYIGQFGKDLYISLASYLKPPVSYFRVAVLAAMALFWLYMVFGFSASLEGQVNLLMGGGGMLGGLFGQQAAQPNPSSLVFLLCIIGPLGALNSLLLFLFLAYSLYKWVTDNDLLAGLRTKPNEFNEDDMLAMEKAVEATVRMAMDDIGLPTTNMRPTSVQPPVRLI
jgi:hypothetical protein